MATAGAVGALAACGGDGGGRARSEPATTAGSGTVEVVAGFYPLAFAAEAIGGPAVHVANLTPPGAEPHDIELSARDIERIRSADLVLYLGSGFQPALEDAAPRTEGVAVDLLDGLELLPGGDPHVWLDPARFALVAERIGQALGRAHEAARLTARLERLDAEYRRGLADCARREIVTSHAAFGYLADRYRLAQIAVSGLAPGAEPAPRDLERVARRARESGATTIFVERLVSPEVAEAVAREIGARTAVLDPLEGLTADEERAGHDYFGVMRRNLAALREALGCK